MSLPDIKIHTTIGIRPRDHKKVMQYLRRGATMTLTYDLFQKAITFEDVEQVTFCFKQFDKTIYYTFFDYFKPTGDRVAEDGKNYYTRIPANSPFTDLQQYRFEINSDIKPGDPISAALELFEETTVSDLENENWQIDNHFQYEKGDTYEYVKVTLTSDETMKYFEASDEDFVKYEVAIQLDTDRLEGMAGRDSIIIEPQCPFIVIDSIYAGLANTAADPYTTILTASEKLYCDENLYCRD